MEDKLLSLIIDYKMDKLEAKAWKVAILYMQLAREYFPDYKHYRLGKRDPRKSVLFRHCYKLVRECDGLLEDFEYRMYITAQLQVLKNIIADGSHALVNPNCLVGPKAWKRWLVWKKRFQNSAKQETVTASVSETEVHAALRDTKKFLTSRFRELNKQSIIDSLKNRNLFRWCALSKISAYYVALSPVVQAWAKETGTDLLESFTIDLSYYRASVTKDVESFFRSEFAYEF